MRLCRYDDAGTARAAFYTEEQIIPLDNTLPGFVMVDVNDVARRTLQLPLDANGDLTISYNQPAGWTGLFAFQALLYDGDGNLIGTSDFVIND